MERSAPRAGVVGWPIEHSRSPIIHGYWLKELGIRGTYEKFAVRPGEFPAFAATIGDGGLVGVNVTVPHKEAAFGACDERTPVAEALGAVNTLWREDGRLMGDNTGCRRLPRQYGRGGAWAGPSRENRPLSSAPAAPPERSSTHCSSAASSASRSPTERKPEPKPSWRISAPRQQSRRGRTLPMALPDADLLVNASSLGMVGQPPLAVDIGLLPERAVVADVVYVPLRTPLIQTARARGHRAVEGLGMLLHQAAPAFARWFGRKPTVTPALREMVEAEVIARHGAGR